MWLLPAGARLLPLLLAVAFSSTARSRSRAASEVLRRDLRTWLARGGASALEAEEKIGEQNIDVPQQQVEDDTNEKIIEALLVKQKRLEGQNHALRVDLAHAQAQARAAGSARAGSSPEVGNSEALLALRSSNKALAAKLAASPNQTATLRSTVAHDVEEARYLRQSLTKAKRALLQSVDTNSAASADAAAASSQAQELAEARAENARLKGKLNHVSGHSVLLQASVTKLESALNQSLAAVSQAEHQLAGGATDAGAVGDKRLADAQHQIAQLKNENMQLKVAGHTLMMKFDALRAHR